MTVMQRKAQRGGESIVVELGHCDVCGATVWQVRSDEIQRPGDGMYYEFDQGPPYLVPCQHPAGFLVRWISWKAATS